MPWLPSEMLLLLGSLDIAPAAHQRYRGSVECDNWHLVLNSTPKGA
jgi:hypothetical protein